MEALIDGFFNLQILREALPYLKQSKQARIVNISGTRGREPGGVAGTASR